MTAGAWRDPGARSVALYLDGADAPDLDADGRSMLDDDFLVLVNAWWEPLDFAIPGTRPGQTWLREIGPGGAGRIRRDCRRAPFAGGAAGVVEPVIGPAIRRGSRRHA
jgi:hypothetical protein